MIVESKADNAPEHQEYPDAEKNNSHDACWPADKDSHTQTHQGKD
jgi:hypothetical protein